ncbi:SRPBCC family protein [Cellvibrio polysaccharolyticus]|uniref:SRPBCC domain-containing protein n=1 Tax=Cellvibrio polysaccharolyticus TaxID=2082724 RepID=A0A928V2H6_9GAMM|nr:SRPBCC domain-containing protein [Cellvibrio polysaccharolyticus]MBE8715970.1 SRPBCC domain-containing protein [Cellvibrio polysaccharolyticus]
MSNPGSHYDIAVEHTFTASPDKVFDAWLNPQRVEKWFGPGLGEMQPVSIDANVGGSFRIVQIRNGHAIGHSGKYLVIDRPEHLAFTWGTDDDEGDDEVHIHLVPVGRGSLLRLVHTIDSQWKDYADKIHQSWLAMMKKMDSLLAS